MHTNTSVLGLMLSLWLSISGQAAAQSSSALTNLRPEHPRLLFTQATVSSRKQLIASDPVAKGMYDDIKKKGEDLVKKDETGQYSNSLVTYTVVGGRLLDMSRRALGNIETLAGLYLLDSDPRWAERARKDMLDVAAFPSWNPSHFLDVAEMTMAMAVGYDWLYPTLSADDRSKIRQAIIDKGLIPGQQAFTSGAWWTKATNNWSQVCNGGLLSGAVAIADESPDLAGSIIESSKISLQKGMSMFSPDGAGLEGLTYWNYGLRYNIYYLEGATTALGTDFGLSQLPGFSVTGHYRLHMVSPIKKSFSYSDQNADVFGAGGVVLWLARKFNQPLYARFEYDNFGLGGVESLLWYEPSLINSTNVLPTAAYFREAEVVAMRSDWKNPNAWYAGFKNGDNQANHGHLDLGSFVVDALGQRWGEDLGIERLSYDMSINHGNSKDQNARKWSYYRLKTEGHNTLTISSRKQTPLAYANQNVLAKSKVTKFESSPAKTFALTDLTQAYQSITGDDRQVTKAQRGIMLLGNQQLLVQDEVEATVPVDIIWNFHTQAQISISGKTATLSRGGQTIKVEILVEVLFS